MASATATATPTPSPKRPNIIFIMADDHAAKAISAYGAGINHTPHIDRLAHEGRQFHHCYVTNSICTPSRAAILTGTHNHVNGVTTLDSKINTHLPNVAKHLRTAGYQTAMLGKWHLGEGPLHEPSGFDVWSVVPDQGDYWDPTFLGPHGAREVVPGYATDIITDKTLAFLAQRDRTRPFFVMCHHKAPHRSWECHDRHKHLYKDHITVPATYTDDYKHRARAAKAAKMRVAEDMTYFDLGLAQPDGGQATRGERLFTGQGFSQRKVPAPTTAEELRDFKLIDVEDGTVFTFATPAELAAFKYQRYMQRYLRTIQAIDDSVGRILAYLEDEKLDEDTMVIYTSDQGFFLGEHGWFDKRFMYEESFQMPLLVRYPREMTNVGVACDDILCNVDFAPTFLDFAGVRIPSYMQGVSFRALVTHGAPPAPPPPPPPPSPGPGPSSSSSDDGMGARGDCKWQQVAYHRYWMNNDWVHHARAHYGVRDQRYKLIYWYNQALGVGGAREPAQGEEEREWELFDCVEDPLELFNVYAEPRYRETVRRMTVLLERKMAEIGDEPVHVSDSLEASFRAA